jgi:hypothetical protein
MKQDTNFWSINISKVFIFLSVAMGCISCSDGSLLEQPMGERCIENLEQQWNQDATDDPNADLTQTSDKAPTNVPYQESLTDQCHREPIQVDFKEIHVIEIEGNNIYYASRTLPSGEIAYFASEPIYNTERLRKWHNYSYTTQQLVDDSRGILGAGIGMAKKKGIDWFKTLLVDKHFFLTESPLMESFVTDVDSYISSRRESSDIKAPFAGIASGCIGMQCAIGTRVNYISKKPIIGLFTFPKETPKPNNLDDYISAYNDIVMSVSTFHIMHDNEAYQHRGIFRNPLSMIRRDYKGLALSLHAFAACAWKLDNPQAKIMMVNPDFNDVMRDLLNDEFKDNEFLSDSTKSSEWGMIKIYLDALTKRFVPLQVL